MNDFYIYLVSAGVYSSYGIECIAVSPRKWTEEELEKLIDKIKTTYKDMGLSPALFNCNGDKLTDILMNTLLDNKFIIVYPSGEFHHDNYNCLNDLSASAYTHPLNEPSAFRMGLA